MKYEHKEKVLNLIEIIENETRRIECAVEAKDPQKDFNIFITVAVDRDIMYSIKLSDTQIEYILDRVISDSRNTIDKAKQQLDEL